MNNLSQAAIYQQLSTGIAAGVTDVNTGAVDTRAVEGSVFAISLGTFADATAVMKIKVQQSDDGLTDWEDIEHPLTDVAYEYTVPNAVGDLPTDQLVLIETTRQRMRYLRLAIERETANSAIRSIVVNMHGLRQKPAAQHSTVVGTFLVRD